MTKSTENDRRKMTKKPYNERSDLDKLRAQWTKLSGLHRRDEPSAAIVRCATAAEVAANYAIRSEWSRRTDFDAVVIDHFLRWANGLQLKVTKLFVPVYFSNPAKEPAAKALIKSAEKINAVRNAVVHQGSFSNPEEAEAAIVEAKTFINAIVGLSIPDFDIGAATESGDAIQSEARNGG